MGGHGVQLDLWLVLQPDTALMGQEVTRGVTKHGRVSPQPQLGLSTCP